MAETIIFEEKIAGLLWMIAVVRQEKHGNEFPITSEANHFLLWKCRSFLYFMKIGIIYMIINECLFYFTNVSDACWGFILHVNLILDTVTRVLYAWAIKTHTPIKIMQTCT